MYTDIVNVKRMPRNMAEMERKLTEEADASLFQRMYTFELQLREGESNGKEQKGGDGVEGSGNIREKRKKDEE